MENAEMISEMKGFTARALLIGCACVVKSDLTPGQIEKFEIYMPEALQLKDPESGEVLFSVSVNDGPGCITEDGAVYSHTATADGKATITLVIDPDMEDKVSGVRDRIGHSLGMLDALEKQMAARLPALAEKEKKTWELFMEL